MRSRAVLIAALATVTLVGLTACGQIRPRGAGYKRLIATHAESLALTRLAEQRIAEAEAAGQTPDPELVELHETARTWHETVGYNLANRVRTTWHRTKMNGLWGDYLAMFPEDRATKRAFADNRRVPARQWVHPPLDDWENDPWF